MKILLPVNLKSISESTHNALKWLSSHLLVELDLIHVIDPSYFAMGDMNGNIVMHSDTFNIEMNDCKDELDDLKKELKESYPFKEVHSELLIGSIENQVIERCEKQQYDLIISETDGTHSFFKTLSGSLTGNLTRKITAPVLALPHKNLLTNPIESIMIAHEFSEDAFDLKLSDDLKIFEELQKLVKHIILAEIVKDHHQVELSNQSMQQFAKLNKIESADYFNPVNHNLEEGLNDCIRQYPKALLCIGNHQHKGFNYFLEGCTAAELINRYDRPLLSFPLSIRE
jgi:nucleotide-binding universal stress UspA family protein